MKKTGRRQEESGNGWMGVMAALLKGSVLALAVTLLVLFLCSAAVSAQWLSQSAAGRGVEAACVLGALAGGRLGVRKQRELSLALGLGTGGALFLLLLCGGVLLYESAPVTERMLSILLACLCGGAIAGILGRRGRRGKRSAGRGKKG